LGRASTAAAIATADAAMYDACTRTAASSALRREICLTTAIETPSWK
jgi:hypothetical protein